MTKTDKEIGSDDDDDDDGVEDYNDSCDEDGFSWEVQQRATMLEKKTILWQKLLLKDKTSATGWMFWQ